MGIWEWNERPINMTDDTYTKYLEKYGVSDTPGGIKHDGDKPPIALIDPEYLEGTARVLAFGAKKYEADNWRLGISYRRLISAAYRHLGEINKGIDLDPETGESHAYHLSCCTMFLAHMLNHRPDMDDRYKGGK